LTQYATASQKTARKKKDRFLITSHRFELKKLLSEAEYGARSEFVI
jgi:elongation factor P--beta-lysine ligase